MDKALFSALSLCQKAGALRLGFDAAKQSLQKGEAALLLFAEDASPKTVERILAFRPAGLPARKLACTQEELAALCRKPVGVLAVADPELARLCLSKMADGAENWKTTGQKPEKIEKDPETAGTPGQ